MRTRDLVSFLGCGLVAACSIPDKNLVDVDAAAIDAATTDAASTDAPTDATPPPSSVPSLLFPWNGYTTGSVHAVATSVLPRRPTFKWLAAADATHYRIEYKTGCTNGVIQSCAFTGATSATVTTTSFTPSNDLTTDTTPPVGDRIFWRVSACSSSYEASCGTPSPIRYVDVGRRHDDVNGDGYGDAVIGAVYNGTGTAGRAYLFLGTAGGLMTAGTSTLMRNAADSTGNYGHGVAYGDLNGDGFADVSVGAPRFGANEDGIACVYMGNASGLSVPSGAGCMWSTAAPAGSGLFGYNVTIGDLDADGFGDLTVAALQEGGAGRLWTFRGTSTTPMLTGTSIDSPITSNLALGLDATGDVNGDGYVDLIAGAAATPGTTYVFRGSVTGPVSTAYNTIANPSSCSQFGYSIDAGDVDGDGYADAAIGCDPGSASGRVYVFRGSPTGLPTAPNTTLLNPQQTAGGSAFCRVSLGDIDGDGDHDLIAAAYANDIASGNEGIAYFYQSNAGTLAAPVPLQSPVVQQNASFGSSVDFNHDFNGDGRADLVIAASGQTGSMTQDGVVFVFPTTGVGAIGAGVTYLNPASEVGGAFGVNLRH